jgi:hypothetical protein
LTSWGMHRMGELVDAKLTEFDAFQQTLQTMIHQVTALENRSILDLQAVDLTEAIEILAPVISLPGISASDSPFVGNTKTLHFLLPDLVPPMDRTYTMRFFYGYKNLNDSERLFREIYPRMHALAQMHAPALRHEAESGYLCQGHAKGLDNAIVGYVLERLTSTALRTPSA